MIESIGIDPVTSGKELLRLRETLREDDSVVFDGELDGSVSHLGDGIQRIRQPDIPKGRNEADVDRRNIQRLDRSSNDWLLGDGIETSLIQLLGNVDRGGDDEVDPLLFRVTKTGLFFECLDHLTQGQTLELQLIEPDPIQFVGDLLTATTGMDGIGSGERIGIREFGQTGFPGILHLDHPVLCGQFTTPSGAGIAPFVDQGEVMVCGATVGVELGRRREFLEGFFELTQFEKEDAVALMGASFDHFLPLVGNHLEGFGIGQTAPELFQALVIVPLDLLGENVGGIDGQNALQSGVGLAIVTGLDGAVGQFEVDSGETVGGDIALGFNGGSQLLDQTPRGFVGLGGGAQVLLAG